MPRAPRLTTRAVLKALRAREPIFHGARYRRGRAALERLVARDFREIGASGRVYSRAFVIRTVLARKAMPGERRWRTSAFRCRELAPGLYLLTYTLTQGTRRTRRTTLWQRAGRAWTIRFHQGTLLPSRGPREPR